MKKFDTKRQAVGIILAVLGGIAATVGVIIFFTGYNGGNFSLADAGIPTVILGLIALVTGILLAKGGTYV